MIPAYLGLYTPRGQRFHIGRTRTEKLTFRQQNDITYFLIKTHGCRRLAHQLAHRFWEIGPDGFELIA